MVIKESEIFKTIEKISIHYKTNIYNRYVRKALMLMNIPHSVWSLIEDLTEKIQYYRQQGYQISELYDQIIAMKTFVEHAQKEVIPNLKTILATSHETVLTKRTLEDEKEKIIREMAIHNFPANLKILSDLLDELFRGVAEIDKKYNSPPIYEKIPDLRQLGLLK